jgi:hypothetical protein
MAARPPLRLPHDVKHLLSSRGGDLISGILAVDMYQSWHNPFRVRWYPNPKHCAAQAGTQPMSVAKWESRLCFREGWSLPGGDAWHAPLPAGDRELWEVWNDWSPAGYPDDERNECHRLFGTRAERLTNITASTHMKIEALR